MLASGAHVKIGNYEFLLDEGIPEHYTHRLEAILPQLTPIAGEGSPQRYDPQYGRIFWSWTDWSGGEGNRIYYPEEPTKYDYSNTLNPRIRGQLTTRPARSRTTLNVPRLKKRPQMAVGDKALWIGASEKLWYTDDGGASWTSKASGLVGSGLDITAMVGDDRYLYYTAWSTVDDTRVVKRVSRSGSQEDVEESVTDRAAFTGMAIMNGRLYLWTGRKLFEWDIFESMPLDPDKKRKVFDTGVDPDSANPFSSSWWADCVSAENSVFFFYSSDAVSNLYEFKAAAGLSGVARPVWRAPYGFTIKAIAYQNGVVYCTGHWSGDENYAGHGAIYAYPLDTRRPVFVGWFRKQQNVNLQMQEITPSYGSQVMVAAANTGRIFIYDHDLDSITMFDDLDSGRTPDNNSDGTVFASMVQRVGSMATFGRWRFATIYQPDAPGSGNIQVLRWATDEEGDRENGASISGELTSGSWDFDIPLEKKTLIGFHVLFEPLTAGQQIQIGYSIDGGSFVSAGTITPATPGASAGKVFLQVSSDTSTVQFYRLTLRIKLTGGPGPILKAVTTEARIIAHDESWTLLLRVKDEQNSTRPTNRAAQGPTIRDWLLDAANARIIVPFQDGYRYKLPGTYSQHQVIIEEVSDVIQRQGEGIMRVTLRRVP
jgi:hypothetical protein